MKESDCKQTDGQRGLDEKAPHLSNKHIFQREITFIILAGDISGMHFYAGSTVVSYSSIIILEATSLNACGNTDLAFWFG